MLRLRCVLQMLGLPQHSCSPSMHLRDCTRAFPDDKSFTVYSEQLGSIDRRA